MTKATSTAAPTPTVPFTYTVTVTNATAAANGSCAYGAVVTDPMPAVASEAIVLVSAMPAQGTGEGACGVRSQRS